VRLLAAEGHRIFSTSLARELAPRAGLKQAYVVEALHLLSRTGWIVPLRRGLYALSSSVPGITPVHEFEIAMALVQPAAISHWSALHYHGLTDQAPHKVYVLTTIKAAVPQERRRAAAHGGPPGEYWVQQTPYRFVQVRPKRYFGTEKVWIGEARVTITDRERTLLDGLSMPQYCGDFGEVLHAFNAGLRDLRFDRAVAYALRLDAASVKRLGWVLERHGASSHQLAPLLEAPINGYRKLDASGPASGPRNRRWMLQENIPGRLKP
jgi:predicted transcriptional regulator of viral defense system